MSWPTYYTNNFCPNPSVEVSTAGYGKLLGTESLSQDVLAWAGSQSLLVTTPGNVTGEGVSTPAGTVVASATGSATAYIYGETGTLTIQAVQNPGGQILGTTFVTLDGSDWQRVEIDNLGLTVNDTLQLIIFTTTPQALTFWVDAVQYEPESPAHPYVDGDSRNGSWAGTPGLSTSYQQYQHPVQLDGGMVMEGTISVVAHGEVFSITTVIVGQMDMSGDAHQMVAVSGTRTVIKPAIDTGLPGLPWMIGGGGSIASTLLGMPGSGFTDFAIFESGVDPDPAMTLIGYNNAGTKNASDTATSWAQLFGTFSPPQQSLDSGGRARWQSAAYMAAGFRIASQSAYSSSTAPNNVNFTSVQVEQQTKQGPTAYQLPRSLSTIIKPSRMNYVTNPSFEANASTGWNAIGGATLTVVEDGFEGTYALQVSVPSAGGGVYIMVGDLILGDVFAASAYIEPVSGNINDVTMTAGTTETSANPTGYLYGSGQYGSGPYGGVANPAVSMYTGAFGYRPFTAFTAPASSSVLSFIPVAVTGATYPLVFNIDCAMVEPGEILNPYGDGSTSGWGWELGGTPGLCRSYYYERENVGVNAVQSVLAQHIPLGLSANAPEWFLPPTQ